MYIYSSMYIYVYINVLYIEIVFYVLLFIKCVKLKIFLLFRFK